MSNYQLHLKINRTSLNIQIELIIDLLLTS